MKTLKDFTQEVQNKIPEYIARALSGVFDGGRYNNFTLEKAQKAVWNVYSFCKYKNPVVLVAENPYEAQIMFNYIQNNKALHLPLGLLFALQNGEKPEITDSQLRSQLDSQLDSQLRSQLRSQLDSQLRSQLRSQLFKKNEDFLFGLNVYADSYFSWYSFMKNELKLPTSENAALLDIFMDLNHESGIYSAIFSEALCVVSKFPKKVHRNAANNMHNPLGPAVEWGYSDPGTKFDGYYINGRNLPGWIWEKAANGEITKELFLGEKNLEIKGGIYEVLGQKKMMDLLGAEVIDVQTIAHQNGDLETVTLLKTKEKFEEIGNVPFAWVKMVCPSTGTQYLVGCEPHHTNALEAIASLSMFKAKDYSFSHRS